MFNVSPSITPLIDIGANLTHESFANDLDQVLARARQANITHMIVTGSDLRESEMAAQLAHAQPELLSATAGIHPHYADQFCDDARTKLCELITRKEVSAIGETGLDYYRDISPREKQRESFIAHLELAKESSKPLFLHQRDAHSPFLAILKDHRAELGNIVVHCFTDTAPALHDYLKLDCYIGITGWICDERRGAHLLDCVNDIPLDRLMIETDAPYLMPRTLKPKPRTRRNEPCTLPAVLKKIADVRAESIVTLGRQTTKNAAEFFGLDNPVSTAEQS